MKKTLVAPEILESDPTPQPGEDRSSKIFVRPFVDHRRWGSHALHRSWTPAMESVFADTPGDPAPDRDLISRLFLMALKRAGYDAVMEPVAMSTMPNVEAGCVVLEGQLWSFRFETRAAPVLEVDLSLQLRGGDGAEVLWQSDFPEDNTVPLWIGLGCEPRDMVGAALKEVEEVARQQFAAPTFAESVRRWCPSHPSPHRLRSRMIRMKWLPGPAGRALTKAKSKPPRTFQVRRKPRMLFQPQTFMTPSCAGCPGNLHSRPKCESQGPPGRTRDQRLRA